MSASISTERYGLLINYEFCSGCHACEVACKKEHGLDEGHYGIKVTEYGPKQIAVDDWDYFFVPNPTKICDFCADRLTVGRLPTCVHHCLNKVIRYGTVEELAFEMASLSSRSALYTLTES